MTDVTDERYLTAEEAEDFLARHPTLQWVDILLFDMIGIGRGKRIRAAELPALAKKTVMFCSTVYLMDTRGTCCEETGRLWETGDPDLKFRLLADTLAPVDTGEVTHAQVVMVPVEDEGGLDPRRLLQRQATAFAAEDRFPVAAVELEFYLIKACPDGDFKLETPAGAITDPDWEQLYQFDELNWASAFIDDVYRIAEGQGLPVDTMIQESGPAQFEINLQHRSDVVQAGLEGLLLKRAIKAAAKVHGMDVTFMPKPHHDWASSGMHVHMSLVDVAGNNLFAGDSVSPLCRNAIGGLRETMGEFMALWAQSANAYRRYQPKAYVPLAANWAYNNRNVSLRVLTEPAAATRIEHRIAGSDANPYLVLAAMLAGIRHGIAENVDPGEACEGSAENGPALALPLTWESAIARFGASPIVREAFGEPFQTVFTRLKQAERDHFARIVTALDHQWYAHAV
ncbi:glutamine synthetase family protein [Methyloligella sp. 2.7D]|uniref:glutamine synthetase family protein n=1 Tax=unclassified Methyloligella TaxID=2625955 RepID=UPI001FEE6AE2|nr:glutamine synthetase family protein [Methyloligella sp. GL2]